MSDFLKDPNFQPDEETRKFIDSIFETVQLPKAPKKKKTTPSVKIQLPDPEPLDSGIMQFALDKSASELEAFRVAFLEFQDKVTDMAIFSFLHPALVDFGDKCQDLAYVIDDNFNEKEMTALGKADYKELLKIRARILYSVYNKYSKEYKTKEE